MRALFIFMIWMLCTPAHAIVRECSEYPLITYPERATLKKHISRDSKPSQQWRKLSTKQRVEICRSLAKALRNK